MAILLLTNLAKLAIVVFALRECFDKYPSTAVLLMCCVFLGLLHATEDAWRHWGDEDLPVRDTDLRRVYPAEDYRGERSGLPVWMYTA
jgi:hypothetical protein